MIIKQTERGWAGHYICASMCGFRRNTLLERLDYPSKRSKKIIISTVGNYRFGDKSLIRVVGIGRYYETAAFESSYDKYDDIDVTKQISNFNSKWHITVKEFATDKTPDLTANEMHQNVVNEFLNNEELWNIKN